MVRLHFSIRGLVPFSPPLGSNPERFHGANVDGETAHPICIAAVRGRNAVTKLFAGQRLRVVNDIAV